jgi:hypothetical protein
MEKVWYMFDVSFISSLACQGFCVASTYSIFPCLLLQAATTKSDLEVEENKK